MGEGLHDGTSPFGGGMKYLWIGQVQRMTAYSAEWLRRLETRGVFGEVKRINGRRVYSMKQVEKIRAYSRIPHYQDPPARAIGHSRWVDSRGRDAHSR